jgi:hypothetical protein
MNREEIISLRGRVVLFDLLGPLNERLHGKGGYEVVVTGRAGRPRIKVLYGLTHCIYIFSQHVVVFGASITAEKLRIARPVLDVITQATAGEACPRYEFWQR